MRFFIDISYDGTNYHGWQIQPNAKTIQDQINKAISTILNQEINVVGAGRTDTGVHAKQLIAHFGSASADQRDQMVEMLKCSGINKVSFM